MTGAELVAGVQLLASRQTRQRLAEQQAAERIRDGIRAEVHHLLYDASGLDVWACMAVDHPEACGSDDDYPDWTPKGAKTHG